MRATQSDDRFPTSIFTLLTFAFIDSNFALNASLLTRVLISLVRKSVMNPSKYLLNRATNVSALFDKSESADPIIARKTKVISRLS